MTVSLPKITVIIAVRNGAATLQGALDSVFGQTYEHVELIVIDGASTDGTVEIIERNASGLAYWESKRDRGIYHAWNKALDHATGDWMCFLGADDRLHAPDVLARLAPHLIEVAGRYRIVYGRIRVIRHDGSLDKDAGIPWEAARRRFSEGGVMIPHPGTFHHRSMFDRHGRFDEKFRIVGDYEFLLRELLHHDALFVPNVVVDMGAGGLSERAANAPILAREVHRARYAHGLESVPEWRSFRVIRAVVRGWLSRTFGRRTADAVADVYRFIARRP